MDRYSSDYTEVQRAIKREAEARERRKARWNDPDVQAIEAQRREMYAEAERNRIQSLRDQIPQLRSELDRADKARAVKEAELRRMVADLAELTGPEVPAEVEADPSEPIHQPEPVEVDEAPRGRGRPRRVTA